MFQSSLELTGRMAKDIVIFFCVVVSIFLCFLSRVAFFSSSASALKIIALFLETNSTENDTECPQLNQNVSKPLEKICFDGLLFFFLPLSSNFCFLLILAIGADCVYWQWNDGCAH